MSTTAVNHLRADVLETCIAGPPKSDRGRWCDERVQQARKILANFFDDCQSVGVSHCQYGLIRLTCARWLRLNTASSERGRGRRAWNQLRRSSPQQRRE